jgi:hypothetical protein
VKPKGNPSARACIEHAEAHTAGIGKGGRRLAYLSPDHEVLHQNEPTPAHPVSQHKQFKGHSTYHGTVGREPK